MIKIINRAINAIKIINRSTALIFIRLCVFCVSYCSCTICMVFIVQLVATCVGDNCL